MKLGYCSGSACGGCDVALLDTGEGLLDLVRDADIVFWPMVTDFKYEDLAAGPGLDLALFSGAVRTTRDEEVARLARRRAKVMVAVGSCAVTGGIVGLADLAAPAALLQEVYVRSVSADNEGRLLPRERFPAPAGELSLPGLATSVRPLDEVVPVDYYLPGCPPPADRVGEAVRSLLEGSPPPAGRVLGADDAPLCRECPRVRQHKKVARLYRLHEIIPDRENCLLEQGLVCLGPVTRAGCGAACLEANMPCRGCAGPPSGVVDQAAALIGALGSLWDVENPAGLTEALPDPTGTLLRFSLAKSLLKGVGWTCRG